MGEAGEGAGAGGVKRKNTLDKTGSDPREYQHLEHQRYAAFMVS